MITVGAFEAKTTLSALLERVAAGEEVLITKHGRAVARLVPAGIVDRSTAKAAIAAMRRESQGRKLLGLPVRKLRESDRAEDAHRGPAGLMTNGSRRQRVRAAEALDDVRQPR